MVVEPYRLGVGRGRKIQIVVVLALLWVAIGNAVLHLPVITVYGIAALVALATWFITSAIGEHRN
jgi:fatty acid desaturase